MRDAYDEMIKSFFSVPFTEFHIDSYYAGEDQVSEEILSYFIKLSTEAGAVELSDQLGIVPFAGGLPFYNGVLSHFGDYLPVVTRPLDFEIQDTTPLEVMTDEELIALYKIQPYYSSRPILIEKIRKYQRGELMVVYSLDMQCIAQHEGSVLTCLEDEMAATQSQDYRNLKRAISNQPIATTLDIFANMSEERRTETINKLLEVLQYALRLVGSVSNTLPVYPYQADVIAPIIPVPDIELNIPFYVSPYTHITIDDGITSYEIGNPTTDRIVLGRLLVLSIHGYLSFLGFQLDNYNQELFQIL